VTARKQRIAVLAAGVVAGATMVVVAGRSQPEAVPTNGIQADAALVLSGDVGYLRVAHASALVRDGRVKAVLLTGKGVGGDSGTEMGRRAAAAGVPPEAIVVETESTSTRENVLFAAPLVRQRGWRRVALVTSQSHLARAMGAARKVMPEVEWVPAPVPDAGTPARARRLRAEEAIKLLWYKARGWA
jgi:uncharacterized SAM-binding protein YcdF (DUF218 family)